MPSRRDPSEVCTVVLWLKHASRCVLAPCALGTVERLAFPASRLHRHSQMRRPLPHPCCEADRAAIHPDGACREHWVIMRVTPPRRGRGARPPLSMHPRHGSFREHRGDPHLWLRGCDSFAAVPRAAVPAM